VTELSIIIANYNGGAFLEECLESIYRHAPSFSFEIIVVDNASRDGSPDRVEKGYPEVRLIRNAENRGYARANNQGLRIARGNYLLLLNSDIVLRPKAFDETVAFLRQRPDVGVVSPKILNSDGSTQVTAKSFPKPIHMLFGRSSFLTRYFPNNPISRRYLLATSVEHTVPHEVDYVAGAYLLTRRDVVERVGLLDEAMWMYWEDADWCRRIKNEGWKVVFYPLAEVVHHLGGSSRTGRARLIYWFHRSIFHYYRKHDVASGWHPAAWMGAILLGARAIALIAADGVKSGIGRLAGSRGGST
jgi:GT2 family glycosyltransferase